MLLFQLLKLFDSLVLTHKLRWHRVGEDEHPRGQEKLTARDQQEEREGHELAEVTLHLPHSLLLFEAGSCVGLLLVDLVLDDPLAIFE